MLKAIVEKVPGYLNRRKLKYLTKFAVVGSRINPNKVVATSYYGEGFSCNPKYIVLELHRISPTTDIVWLAKHSDDSDYPDYIRTVPYGSLRAQRELATATVWINNTRGPRYINKNKEQFYIQTCHSSLSAKRCEADVADRLDANYVRSAQRDGAETDLMFANNAFREQLYKTSYWYDGPVIRCGVPRNRPLVFPDSNIVHAIKSRYGIDNRKICLYAPTFRKDSDTAVYRFDYAKCLQALNSRFDGEFVFCMRLHPNIAHLSSQLSDDRVVDVTDYPDCQELLSASDVLISDYSSVLEDFTLTRRPGFVFAPDYDDYLNDRGFYYPLDVRPYPVARNESELFQSIESFSDEQFASNVDAFFKRFDFKDDGMGARRIAQIIVERMKGRSKEW